MFSLNFALLYLFSDRGFVIEKNRRNGSDSNSTNNIKPLFAQLSTISFTKSNVWPFQIYRLENFSQFSTTLLYLNCEGLLIKLALLKLPYCWTMLAQKCAVLSGKKLFNAFRMKMQLMLAAMRQTMKCN